MHLPDVCPTRFAPLPYSPPLFDTTSWAGSVTPLGPANSSTFVYVGQGFRTGPNPAGYWLTAVKLQIEDGTHTSYPNLSVPVSLWVSRHGRLEEQAGLRAAPILCTLLGIGTACTCDQLVLPVPALTTTAACHTSKA